MNPSMKIFFDILLSPATRSANVIGTSTTRAPARLATKVVSIWKTRTCPASSRPIRHAELCSAEFLWSMNEREWTIVWLL